MKDYNKIIRNKHPQTPRIPHTSFFSDCCHRCLANTWQLNRQSTLLRNEFKQCVIIHLPRLSYSSDRHGMVCPPARCLSLSLSLDCRLGLTSFGLCVKLLLSFASGVFPGFSLLEIHGQDISFLLNTYMFPNGTSLQRERGRSFHESANCGAPQFQPQYIRSVIASSSLSTSCTLCHCTALNNTYTEVQRSPVKACFFSRLCLKVKKKYN
jgi:hypothetical protein